MSRGFVKEEDQEEAPFIPPRAALPAGVTNYVTPTGYNLLLAEREEMEAELSKNDLEDEKEKRHFRAVITGKLTLLNERIASARIIDPKDQNPDEVRFGAIVNFCRMKDRKNTVSGRFQLVGVDEADIKQHKIAFVAPIARALTGKKKGEEVKAFIAGEEQLLKILDIEY